jgi:hypothetical protein
MADSEFTQLGNLYSKAGYTCMRALLLAVLCTRPRLVLSRKVKIKGNHLGVTVCLLLYKHVFVQEEIGASSRILLLCCEQLSMSRSWS